MMLTIEENRKAHNAFQTVYHDNADVMVNVNGLPGSKALVPNQPLVLNFYGKQLELDKSWG